MHKKISSPKEFDTYIKVAQPSFWMILIAVTSIVVGGLIWSLVAEIEMTMSVYAVASEGQLIAYIDVDEAESITLDTQVSSDFGTLNVKEKSQQPISYQECISSIPGDYTLALLAPGTWNTVVTLDAGFEVENWAIYEVVFVTETTSPFGLLFY